MIVIVNSLGIFQGCVIQSFTRRSASLALKSDKSPSPVSPHPLLSRFILYMNCTTCIYGVFVDDAVAAVDHI